MSVRKNILEDETLCEKILAVFTGVEKPTLAQVARTLEETYQNVRFVVEKNLPTDVYQAEKALRYSRSKTGPSNPMTGRVMEQHHLWKGAVSDNKGHMTIMTESGKRQFVHRLVWAQALGVPVESIAKFHVHHIDGNGTNNAPDNLALVTKKGHRQLHRVWSELKDSPLWERYKSLISY